MNTPRLESAGGRSPWWVDGVGWVGGAGRVGRKVRLREIGPADRRTLIGFDRDAAGGRDPRIGGYRHWAAHRAEGAGSGDDRHLAIEALHGRMLVGSMWVLTDPAAGRFSYGIGIGAQHRRCGYAGDAVTVLLAFMFGERGYRKCEVGIYGGNFASLSLHGELGFREEGRPRDTELVRGEIRYPVLMGITAGEFAAHHHEYAASSGDVRRWRGRHWRTRRRGRHWRTNAGVGFSSLVTRWG
ncbi:RimJ/RimL family protein N-acetyltransferase [Saccharothrix tamanrassetensis]|uniref:RimJ/RimL family protein N-acetyltransferase n=1 Tax=Saccharothrix tamanrassetensis TaxID=1051531 RepID=A0A841CL11_9PSEU|nr:RimJ/RimL family protein N-acetyltransferase [Saccharothrix tamanrassetensis]